MTELDPFKNIFGQPQYRDKLGREIETDELELLLRDKDYKFIAQEQVGKFWVSTVWLGVPHDWPANKYFETIVFLTNGNEVLYGDSCDLRRYETLMEAEQGHKEVVEEYRGKDD